MQEKTEKNLKEDLERAKQAMQSAERNLKENDILTAANRNFVACENAVHILPKSKFGSNPISRIKILTRLKEINPKAKEIYDNSYDLRVQADYGKQPKTLPLNKDNIEKNLNSVRELIEKAKESLQQRNSS